MRALKRRGPDPDKERGAAGVLVAIMLLALIGVGAIAVDVGQIYAERAELQSAADAGALAGAQICSGAVPCAPADASAVASLLANQNSKDGVSRVRSVNLAEGSITVSVATVNGANGSGFLSKMFASALAAPDVGVGATATANWLYPTRGRSVLPLTFAGCEFHDDGLPHKILTQGGGSGAVDCNGRNPSNQIIPGGFAWLAPTTGCQVTAEVGQWSQTSPGASLPAGCDTLFNPSLLGQTIAIPVYAYTCKDMLPQCTGSNVRYMIQKWAGFTIQGWSLPGNSAGPNVFQSSEKGIYGTFVAFYADPSIFTGGSTTPNGNVIIIGLVN